MYFSNANPLEDFNSKKKMYYFIIYFEKFKK